MIGIDILMQRLRRQLLAPAQMSIQQAVLPASGSDLVEVVPINTGTGGEIVAVGFRASANGARRIGSILTTIDGGVEEETTGWDNLFGTSLVSAENIQWISTRIRWRSSNRVRIRPAAATGTAASYVFVMLKTN